MTETAEQIEDRLADFTRDKRILLLSVMAIIIGVMSAMIAKALVWLIAIVTNFTFYQRFSSDFVSPTNHHLGPFVIFAPIVGGLIIGLMERYGSEKIRGHGIPEALEAILWIVRWSWRLAGSACTRRRL
jgi:CIC family chloride channel protein